ncbi:MAG: hypothetical protein HY236_11735 [Acidobacteria bacterium]|nr:hypothetical protein [Acidobacteriota bacterium]
MPFQGPKSHRTAYSTSFPSLTTTQITRLAPTGALVEAKSLIVEFDDSELKAMLEDAQLEVAQAEEKIKKADADQKIKRKKVIYVRNGQRFEPRTVKLGKRTESQVAILEGLREGEWIALADPEAGTGQASKKTTARPKQLSVPAGAKGGSI